MSQQMSTGQGELDHTNDSVIDAQNGPTTISILRCSYAAMHVGLTLDESYVLPSYHLLDTHTQLTKLLIPSRLWSLILSPTQPIQRKEYYSYKEYKN